MSASAVVNASLCFSSLTNFDEPFPGGTGLTLPEGATPVITRLTCASLVVWAPWSA